MTMVPLQVRGSATTETPMRYVKQLASHAAASGLEVKRTDDSATIALAGAQARLVAEDGRLSVLLSGEDVSALASAKEIVGSHLEAFGRREALQVRWS